MRILCDGLCSGGRPCALEQGDGHKKHVCLNPDCVCKNFVVNKYSYDWEKDWPEWEAMRRGLEMLEEDTKEWKKVYSSNEPCGTK